MTLTAVDTLFALIGADNNIDGDDKKKGDTNEQIGLFAQLLQGTSVQQVTKIELRRDFDAALQLHDGTRAGPEDTRTDHRSYDGIGLDTSKYADAGSSRSDKRLDDVRDDRAVAAPVTASREPLDPETSVAKAGNEVASARSGKSFAGQDDGASSRSGLPGQGRATAAANLNGQAALTDGQKQALSNLTSSLRGGDQGRHIGANGQAVSQLASTGGQDNARTDAVARSPIASFVSRSADTANAHSHGGPKATQVAEDLVSQPASSLAASAALSAQTSRPGRSPLETPVIPAGDMSYEARVALLDDGAGRTVAKGHAHQAKHADAAGKALQADAGTTGSDAKTQQNAALFAPRNATAAVAARGDGVPQSGQIFGSDPLAGSTSTNSNQNAQRAQNLQAPPRARPQVPPQYVTNQVAVQIQKAVSEGVDHIRIQLKPAELGRVEVKLEVTEDGRAMAVVTADRSDTLDLLQRDARGLQQALEDAGLRTDSNSLSFNLRGEGTTFDQELAERGHAPSQDGSREAADDSTAEAEQPVRRVLADGRVDVEV